MVKVNHGQRHHIKHEENKFVSGRKFHYFPDESFINGCYIPDFVCDDLITYFNNSSDRHIKGMTYGIGEQVNNLVVDKNVKDSTDLCFNTEAHFAVLADYEKYLIECVKEYERKYERVKMLSRYGITEGINIQKYEPGGGFKKWHMERQSVSTQSRCFAFMTYLNDVPDGGTEFMYQKLISPAKKGLTMIWPSDWTHTHKGQISQTQKKIIITGWLNYQL